MGNATWVCFDCKEAMRRPAQHAEAVPCPQCGRDALCLGTKIRIPTVSDEKSWEILRTSVSERRIAAQERADRLRVRLRHHLEKQITEIEARPANEGRAATLQLLRKQLSSL
jgi:hypothetical protein